MVNLVRNPQLDSLGNIKKYLDPKKGLYFYFRTQSMVAQRRFVELMDVKSAPVVFVHGNPHIDNYARTNTGCGMIDFDRSRMGPYSWDISRLLSSLIVFNHQANKKYQMRDIYKAVLAGYTSRLADPSLDYEKYKPLMDQQPESWQLSTKNYVAANKKWAKRMRMNPMDPKSPKIKELFACYVSSRRKHHFLEKYKIKEAGKANGSMGNKRFLAYFKCLEEGKDDLLLDFKEVYRDPDSDLFYNPYRSHGHRMVEASRLYAAGVEQRVGYGSIGGQEYWIRQVPPLQMKIKDFRETSALKDFAYCVATQLGRAHRNSLLFVDPEKHLKCAFNDYEQIVDVTETLSTQIIKSYGQYVGNARAALKNFEWLIEGKDRKEAV
jgi:hypothetical protein